MCWIQGQAEDIRIPQPEHTAVFFRRTKVTSRAWGSPKIPSSRLRALNPGKENKAESIWICFIVPPGQMPPGVCHTSRTRFECRTIKPNRWLAAGSEKKMLFHSPTPICIEPITKCRLSSQYRANRLGDGANSFFHLPTI